MGIIKPKQLQKLGFTDNTIKSLLINILNKHYKHHSITEIEAILNTLVKNPNQLKNNEVWDNVLPFFLEETEVDNSSLCTLIDNDNYTIFGEDIIATSPIQQMKMAMSLPISIQGALMPDAHQGYGLPIGGVLATNNAVIPYAVGVDIGCRMAMTILDAPASYLKMNAYKLEQAIRNYTHFGMEGGLEVHQEHPIMEDERFNSSKFLQKLRSKAIRQLGSSGRGNHFVEFGIIELQEDSIPCIQKGKYLALLSHSGSRGLGASIAQHFTKIATEQNNLPKNVQHLAWLDMNSEAGQEYWLGMELAGDYAKACHDQIHKNILKALKLKPLKTVENHHNFAWKEILQDGKEVIVHRKGATPANKNGWGIIPGNMVDKAYLVQGLGNPTSLNSAAHGAGRALSRNETKHKITPSALNKLLNEQEVTLIGGSVEESPLAYKSIDEVMQHQSELVTIKGIFTPKIVRMHKD